MNSTIAEILLVVTALAAGFAFIKFGKVIAKKVGSMSESVSDSIDKALRTKDTALETDGDHAGE